MTESDTGTTAPYTDAARARVVMAYEACEVADRARAAVPIGEHELQPDGTTRSPGAMLADAARVLSAAQRFLEAAAVFERVGGADWQLIGDVLGVSPQTARVRFAMAEAGFRDGLRFPEGIGAAGEVTRLWARLHGQETAGNGPRPRRLGTTPRGRRQRPRHHTGLRRSGPDGPPTTDREALLTR